MNLAFNSLNLLLDGESAATTTGQQSNPIFMLVMLGAMVLVFWLFIIRPQKKQKKEEEKMRNELSIGDEIVTIGGIYGRIVSIKEDSFVMESVADKSKYKFAKWAIQQNLTVHDAQEAKEKAAKEKKAKKSKTEDK